MQLYIENKTDICQLVWLSSITCPSREEVVFLKAHERKCLNQQVSCREEITIWDRSPTFRLCHRDCKRMREHFTISMVG